MQNTLEISPARTAETPTDMIAVEVGRREFLAHLTRSQGSSRPHRVPEI